MIGTRRTASRLRSFARSTVPVWDNGNVGCQLSSMNGKELLQ